MLRALFLHAKALRVCESRRGCCGPEHFKGVYRGEKLLSCIVLLERKSSVRKKGFVGESNRLWFPARHFLRLFFVIFKSYKIEIGMKSRRSAVGNEKDSAAISARTQFNIKTLARCVAFLIITKAGA